MDRFVLPSCLESSERILIAGAGGGFDVYCGLPIYHRLRSLGKRVFLANLSFVELEFTEAEEQAPSLYRVEGRTKGGRFYFPEQTLARFLSQRFDDPICVYAFSKVGVKPLTAAYGYLASLLDLDAIVLVDGGTDILLRGDEMMLGTPAEDVASLAACNSLDVAVRLVALVGFGIDSYHGVCHANWLENLADLSAEGAFLGAAALLSHMPEVQFYLDAVRDAELASPFRESIVNGSIASAIEGHFGNYHRTKRTERTEQFINPLMSLLWMCDLAAVARQNLYLEGLGETETSHEVLFAIEKFHAGVKKRPRQSLPG